MDSSMDPAATTMPHSPSSQSSMDPAATSMPHSPSSQSQGISSSSSTPSIDSISQQQQQPPLPATQQGQQQGQQKVQQQGTTAPKQELGQLPPPPPPPPAPPILPQDLKRHVMPPRATSGPGQPDCTGNMQSISSSAASNTCSGNADSRHTAAVQGTLPSSSSDLGGTHDEAGGHSSREGGNVSSSSYSAPLSPATAVRHGDAHAMAVRTHEHDEQMAEREEPYVVAAASLLRSQSSDGHWLGVVAQPPPPPRREQGRSQHGPPGQPNQCRGSAHAPGGVAAQNASHHHQKPPNAGRTSTAADAKPRAGIVAPGAHMQHQHQPQSQQQDILQARDQGSRQQRHEQQRQAPPQQQLQHQQPQQQQHLQTQRDDPLNHQRLPRPAPEHHKEGLALQQHNHQQAFQPPPPPPQSPRTSRPSLPAPAAPAAPAAAAAAATAGPQRIEAASNTARRAGQHPHTPAQQALAHAGAPNATATALPAPAVQSPKAGSASGRRPHQAALTPEPLTPGQVLLGQAKGQLASSAQASLTRMTQPSSRASTGVAHGAPLSTIHPAVRTSHVVTRASARAQMQVQLLAQDGPGSKKPAVLKRLAAAVKGGGDDNTGGGSSSSMFPTYHPLQPPPPPPRVAAEGMSDGFSTTNTATAAPQAGNDQAGGAVIGSTGPAECHQQVQQAKEQGVRQHDQVQQMQANLPKGTSASMAARWLKEGVGVRLSNSLQALQQQQANMASAAQNYTLVLEEASAAHALETQLEQAQQLQLQLQEDVVTDSSSKGRDRAGQACESIEGRARALQALAQEYSDAAGMAQGAVALWQAVVDKRKGLLQQLHAVLEKE